VDIHSKKQVNIAAIDKVLLFGIDKPKRLELREEMPETKTYFERNEENFMKE